jgi:hypothetical protein
LPGTNQVQSMSEWTPKTMTTAHIVSSPMRSGPNTDRRSPCHGPVVRTAAASHAASSARLTPSPTIPRSAIVWTR